uniref:Polyprotein n=1 Tax=Oryza sativa subsp. japonica TaxID=39947 RepID=Q6AV92_ORYSJ|nr:putative polyprotein [Oryza sativa Japonica Group]AAV31327.1 putative polyprotein [Oryza sativa Japonica Group]
MGFVSSIDDFVFPPGQAFRFGSLDFITNDFGKISLLDSDSNQSGRGQISAPFGIPNSAEIYPKIISIELASNHSDEIQSTPTRPDQDDGAYPPILMKLPDDLAAVFTTRASSPRRSRLDPASAPIQPSSREVSVILQPLSTVSTEQLDGYLSSPGVDSRPTEIIEYDNFGYRYDYRHLDDFDKDFEYNYMPLYFGIFMADNETEEQHKAREAEEQRVQQEAERRRLEEEHQAQERERLQREQQERERATKEAEDWRQHDLDVGRRARELIGQQDVEGTVVFRTPQQNAVAAITLLDTLLKEDALNQANHVVNILNQTKTMIAVNILNQTKTMIAASVPVNSSSVRTPTGSRVPPLRSQDYHQPSLSVVGAGSSRRSKGHDERSIHSPPKRHRERRVEQSRSPHRRRPVDLRDTINQRRAARGYAPHHSPDRYDDDVDGVAAFTSDLRRVDWPAGFKPTGIEKYDGTTNPESWLTIYGLAICAAGGDSKAMANYLPVVLADSARSWLHGLPCGTIGSWGTFERPGTQFDLYNVVQKCGESLRDYIRRFSEQRNKISDITDDVIIAAFTKGIRHDDLVGKFGRKPPRTVKQMFEKANEYAKAEDAITASKQSGTTWKPKKDMTTGGSGSTNHKDRKRKPEELMATTTPSSRQRSLVNTFDKIMNSQYHRKELNHIFGGPLAYESKRKQKLTELEINAVQPDTHQYLRWSETIIKFDRSDHPDRVVHPGRYPLVLGPVVRNVKLRRSLIDGLSATPLGQITLPVTFGTRENFRTENVCFEVADFETTYHAILGRPALAKFMAVPHYTYMMMKMPSPRGVISLRSDIKQAVTCDKESCKMAQTREITLAREEIRLAASTASEGEVPVTKMPKSGESDAKTKKIPLDPSDPTKTAVIGAVEVIEHSLHVKEDAKPIKQRLRYFAQDRKDAIKEELTKLLAVGFIKEVLHPDWLANPVLFRKKTGQWRMCVDFTDLNKSCPKDPFGLPRIDQVVDSTAGCELLSFLDCYSGYHQIRLKESDCLKTSFITPFGAYCYITMPFGLKNAGTTYQRMIQRCFNPNWPQPYVDDVVVKIKQKDDLITDLEETFASIRAFRMKLNPEKCIFGVPSGMLLGFMVSHRGIQANLEKINAILNMKSLSSQKDVKKLTGCMAVLSRFVSRLGEQGMLFFKLLKKTDNFQWGPEAQKAFEDFKKTSHYSISLSFTTSARAAIVIRVGNFPGSDFVAEWTECQEDMPVEKMEYWTCILMCRRGFQALDVAEYEALLHGLKISISLGIRHLIVRGDSQLVVNQVMKVWSCLDDNMTAYRQGVCKLEDKFDGLELTHVLRRNNEAADRLANFGSKREAAPSDVFVEHLYEPTVPRKETIEATDTQDVSMIEADWREPLIRFLTKQELPQDKDEAEQISRRSRLYVIHETELYKKSPSGILQRCVSLEEGRQLLKDIHSGICGNHAAARTIVGKAYRQGFFWSTAVSDADKIVRICEGCQFFARQTHLPAQELQTIPLSWSFAVWGLDMVGPFKKVVGGYTHLFVAVDKFSKWIEAKPVITITADKARDFFINIVHRFGVSNRIITDNGTQFTGRVFKDFYEDFGIKICYASVAHPMNNGQVERANGMVLQGIKARVFDRLHPYASKWLEQLPSVLWSLRTTPSRATGQSPFFLVYGAEAMLPSNFVTLARSATEKTE